MTTAQLTRTSDSSSAHPSQADQAARVSFRRPVSSLGFIDAAWWPHSRDLNAELPSLMHELWSQGREINRITYNLTAWQDGPRRMRIEDRIVRLGGFATSDPLTVRLTDVWGRERIDVLVIAPDTEPAVARRALRLAARAGDPFRADEILAQAGDTTAHVAQSRS